MILRIGKSKSNISGAETLSIDDFAMSRSDARPPANLPGVNHRPKIVPERDDHKDSLTPLVADGKSCMVGNFLAIRMRPCEHQEREEPEAVSEQFVQISHRRKNGGRRGRFQRQAITRVRSRR